MIMACEIKICENPKQEWVCRRFEGVLGWYVHISAHGKHEEETLIRSGIFSEIGSREFEEIKMARRTEKPLLMLLSACEVDNKDMATAFS
jgi:hypothetical protein